MHKHRSLTIANTGQVPAAVYFIDRPVGPGQHPGIAPTWLKLKIDDGSGKLSSDFSKRTLEPGMAFNVEIELRILDVGLARALNEGIEQLEDILVLRVENGRDHFIPLRGIWLESSIGHSIGKLIRIPEGGIRKLQRQRPESSKSAASTSSISDDTPVKWSAPRELFRLTEATEDLTVRTTAEWGMLSDPAGERAPWEKFAGWPFNSQSWKSADERERGDRLSAICEALDDDASFDAKLPADLSHLEKLESTSEFLMIFLSAMDDGIVTSDLWQQIEAYLARSEKQKRNQEDQRTGLQEILSQNPSHSISFILITSMLDRIVHEIISASHDNKEWLDKAPDSSFQAAIPEKLRRKNLAKEPGIARKQVLVRGLAVCFSKAMVRSKEASKEKERVAIEERKVRFLELFFG